MAITIDYSTFIINVPQADLTFISGTQYELDIDTFRLALKSIEDSESGMPFSDTHVQRTSEITLGGIVYARIIEILAPYTVTFEDGQYAVDLVGANSNIKDVTNRNQVSVGSNNSAGLIVSGSGLTAGESTRLLEMYKRLALDSGDPWIETPAISQSTSGDIIIDNTGDGEDSLTGTRRP